MINIQWGEVAAIMEMCTTFAQLHVHREMVWYEVVKIERWYNVNGREVITIQAKDIFITFIFGTLYEILTLVDLCL